jgi:hypothetical protein
MTDGFSAFAADSAQIRAHAAKLAAVRERFGAIKGASATITEDSAAYGMLCGWISAILEQRHARQDSLFAYVDENLRSRTSPEQPPEPGAALRHARLRRCHVSSSARAVTSFSV